MANVPRSQSPLDSVDTLSPGVLSPRGDGFGNLEWPRRGSARPQRRGSAASLASSVGGSLDTSQLSSRLSTVADTSQNAISTLLQPPIVRTGLLPHTSLPASAAHRPPSIRDIPPVTLTNIPHVDPSDFKPYLSQVGSLYEARARTENEEKKDKASKDDTSTNERSGSRPPSRDSISSPPGLESPTMLRRRSSGGLSRRGPLQVTPLSTIPQVYFDENFHLENPRTFDVVTERSEVIRTPYTKEDGKGDLVTNGAPAAPRKALATNAILQEKLSWYLDTVEIHLISSISSASKSFFAALGSLKELHSEAADSVAKIQKLRDDLAQLDNTMAVGRLEIVKLTQKKENLRKLSSVAQQLHNVLKAGSHCEELADQGDLEMALDRMAVLEDYTCGQFDAEEAAQMTWLSSEPLPHLTDLRKLKALEPFGHGMNQLRGRIGIGFHSRFQEALLKDLRQHIAKVPNTETLRRWTSASQRARGIYTGGSSAPPAYMETSEDLRNTLASTLVGLKRSKYTMAATAGFRDAINREMKGLIRHNLPSSSDDDNESVASTSTRSSRTPLSQQEKSNILARNIRALGAEDAEELLSKTYCSVGEALRRLQVQCKVLLDVSSDHTLSPVVRSPTRTQSVTNLDAALSRADTVRSPSPNLQEELTQALDLSSLLGQAVDTAQSQVTKVLKVRSEQSSLLDLRHFLRYFSLNRLFADECEAVSGRSGAALKGVINQQIPEFVAKFADGERQKLAQAMEADKWDPCDFKDEDNAALSKVLEGMTSDPPSYLQVGLLWSESQQNGAPKTEQPATNGTSKQVRNAYIDEEKYVLAESAILLLHGIIRFETLIACIPSIASEVSSALTDYLKLFTSLTCQLILGAGAIKSSAGLKNINTRHLALASQGLGFVIALIPYIREFVRRRPGMSNTSGTTGGNSTMADFDKAKRLYQDHQASIHEKLVEIMGARSSSHIKAHDHIDWDADAGRQNASPHMETLAKETANLQRVLGKYFPEAHVRSIMIPVFESYKEGWTKAFKSAKVQTEPGKKRLLRDAELFNAKLSKLEGSNDLGEQLIAIVNDKKVASVKSPSPKSAPENPQSVTTETNGSSTNTSEPSTEVEETKEEKSAES